MNSKKTTNNNSKSQSKREEKYETGAAQEGTPSIPLPNPGEGGAAYPGMPEENMPETGATPVTPLPNPGEGGAAFPGMGWPQTGNNTGNMGGNNIISLPLCLLERLFPHIQDQMSHVDFVIQPIIEQGMSDS